MNKRTESLKKEVRVCEWEGGKLSAMYACGHC